MNPLAELQSTKDVHRTRNKYKLEQLASDEGGKSSGNSGGEVAGRHLCGIYGKFCGDGAGKPHRQPIADHKVVEIVHGALGGGGDSGAAVWV
ncbi:unnamed protein product [Sphagnum balticum]